jgi:carboxylesterase type B
MLLDPLSFHDFLKDNFNAGQPPESEDCLYVNVFAPSTPPCPTGSAVMVFIYGGNFQLGNSYALDGSHFASDEDVILVTFNYRTNGMFAFTKAKSSSDSVVTVFGFPPPDLIPAKQNLGFLDQRMALQWVQKNIHAFGGDPNKVLIFGQSAGAQSVDNLITSIPDNPPFYAAITQSGQYSYLTPGLLDTESAYWESLLNAVNCSNTDNTAALSCLKTVPVDTLRSVIEVGEMIFYPAVDNTTMIYDPINARKTGKFAKVPLMGGNVAQEGPINVFGQDNLTAYLDQNFGRVPSLEQEVIQAYPRQPGETDNDVIARIFADFYFICVSNDSYQLCGEFTLTSF